MLGAIYSRDSRDDGADSFGIDSQTKANLGYGDRHNITVPEEYILEEEWTGTEFSRPKFDRLKRLIEEHRISAVIVYKVNRISRIDYHALMFLREYCFRHKVELHIYEWGRAVKDDSNDSTLFSLQALFGHIDREDILKRTQRGRREKAEQNIPLGQGLTVYGYEKTGAKKNTAMTVIQEEAAIILMIFAMFVQKSVQTVDIARFLNAQGYPSPSAARFWQKAEWNANAVLRILRDSRYTGDWYAFKYVTVDGKAVLREKSEQIKQHFPDLAIIDREMFNAAQAIIDGRRDRYTFLATYEYLLNTRLRCACKHKAGVQTMNKNGKAHQYYRCAHKRRMGKTSCKIPYMNSVKIDTEIWGKLEAFIRNPLILLQELRDAQQAQKNQHEEAVITLQKLEGIRAEYHQKIDRLYTDYDRGLLPEKIYLQRKQPLDEYLRAAEQVYNEHQAMLDQKVLTDREITHIAKECATLADLLDEIGVLEFKHKKRVIELLNVTGELAISGNMIVLTLYIHNLQFKKVILDHQLSSSMAVVYNQDLPHSNAVTIKMVVGTLRSTQA